MPFCHKCGARLEPGDMFCIKCGTKSKEFTRKEENDSQSVIESTEKEQAFVYSKNELLVETVSDNTPVMKSVNEPVQESKPEPEHEVEAETVRIPAVEPIVEPVIESQPEPHTDNKPEIEEIPIQIVEEENFYTEFKNVPEVKPETLPEKPVETKQASQTDPDFAENVDDKKVQAEPEQHKATVQDNLIPLLVTISAIAVAVIVALTFVILILLKKGKSGNENNPTEETSSFYTEFTTSETMTESVTTEETTESEETEDTEEREETEVSTKSSSKTSTDIPINKKHFPDKEFRRCIKDQFDKDHDGKLSKKEISKVTKIDTHDNVKKGADGPYTYAVKDPTGVEYFTELKEIYFAFSNVKSIDISKNSKLKNVTFFDGFPSGKVVMNVGQKLTISRIEDPSGTALYCKSSKSSVANVSSAKKGTRKTLITAKAKGTAKITSKIDTSKSFKITVKGSS